MTIAVDFDGVLTPNGHWPDTGEPNTKMIEWLIMFREIGGKVILWTNRTGKALETAVEFCRYNGLEFDSVNENIPEILGTAYLKGAIRRGQPESNRGSLYRRQSM